jgi:hypothetical protein
VNRATSGPASPFVQRGRLGTNDALTVCPNRLARGDVSAAMVEPTPRDTAGTVRAGRAFAEAMALESDPEVRAAW